MIISLNISYLNFCMLCRCNCAICNQTLEKFIVADNYLTQVEMIIAKKLFLFIRYTHLVCHLACNEEVQHKIYK